MDFKKKMKKFFTMTRKADGGFTLVELIVVIAILAILAGVAVPAYGGYVEKAQMAADQQLLATMNTAFTVACMDKGEYDMTNLSFSPVASNIQTKVEVNKYNTEFLTYFGEGAFKYYDVLSFSKAQGIFVANTVAAIKEELKNAWNGSSFKNGGEAAMGDISDAFDKIGGYFALGFTLDGMLSEAPPEVREAFGFGTFNMKDEEILAKYCADMTAEEIAALTEDEMNIIRGNAYVLHMAEDAAGRSAETITNDVNNLIGALKIGVSADDIIAYYNKLNPDNTTNNIDTARAALELHSGAVPAEMIVAIGTSGVKNTSGVSTLGSMYALAAGFYNSGMATTATPTTYADFDAFKKAMSDPKFGEYLSTKGQGDINAYLNYMNYVSTSDVDMTADNAFAVLGGDIWEIIGGSN